MNQVVERTPISEPLRKLLECWKQWNAVPTPSTKAPQATMQGSDSIGLGLVAEMDSRNGASVNEALFLGWRLYWLVQLPV